MTGRSSWRAWGRLYVGGADVDWAGFDREYARKKVPLPNYPFERQRYWLEPRVKRLRKKPGYRFLPPPANRTVETVFKSNNGKHENNGNGNNIKKLPSVTRPEKLHPSRAAPTMNRSEELNQEILLNTDPAKRKQVLEDFMQKQTARILGMDPSRLGLDQPLDTLGLDSLMAMELKNSLEVQARCNAFRLRKSLTRPNDLQPCRRSARVAGRT
jgi:acyl transferase domain-containing protein